MNKQQGELTTVGSAGSQQGEIKQAVQASAQGEVTIGQGKEVGGIRAAGQADGGGITTSHHQEAVVVVIYTDDEIKDDLKEMVRQARGFVKQDRNAVILPWAKNPTLEVNQRQVDSATVVEKLVDLPFTPNAILAKIQFA